MNKSMHPPLVSIIIPFFNSEGMFEACLQSCIEQTYPNLELIGVNNLSSDRSAEIFFKLAERAPFPCRMIECSRKGANNARPAGYAESKGEYIQWLDADDTLDKNKISIQVKALEHNLACDVAYGDSYLRQYSVDRASFTEQFIPIGQCEEPLLQLLEELWVPLMGYLFRRKIADRLHDIRAWNPYDQHNDDPEYVMCSAVLGAKFLYTPSSISYYSQWSDNQLSRCADPLQLVIGYRRAALRIRRLSRCSLEPDPVKEIHRELLSIWELPAVAILENRPPHWFLGPNLRLLSTPLGVKVCRDRAFHLVKILTVIRELYPAWSSGIILEVTSMIWGVLSYLEWCERRCEGASLSGWNSFLEQSTVLPFRSSSGEGGSNAEVMLALRKLSEDGIIRIQTEPIAVQAKEMTVGKKMNSTSCSVLLLGSGNLGRAIARRLQTLEKTTVTIASPKEVVAVTATNSKQDGTTVNEVSQLIVSSNADIVICCMEGVSGAVFEEVNSALVQTNTKAIFVFAREDSVDIGPTFSLTASSCFVCSRCQLPMPANTSDLSDIQAGVIPPSGKLFDLIDYVAAEVGFEVGRLIAGKQPWLSGGVLSISVAGERDFSESIRTTRCTTCDAEPNASRTLSSFLHKQD